MTLGDGTPALAGSARDTLEEYLRRRDLNFSERQFDQVLAFCGLILRWNRLTSLVQVSTLSELIDGHVIDCLAALDEIRGPHVVDVGSGAGFPGIIFAIAKPNWSFTLIETKRRRARFLTQVKIELGLDHVLIENSRVQDWQSPTPINCITSRAYRALALFHRDCCHLIDAVPDGCVRPIIVALKGRLGADELNELSVPANLVTVKALDVPGRDYRHAVIIQT